MIRHNQNNLAIPEYSHVIEGYKAAIKVVDDVILKNYITKLSELDVIPLDNKICESNITDNVLFFKINEMVYEKDEFATYKFASVFNSLSSVETAIYIIIDSDGKKTDFYMGIRSMDEDRTTSSIRNTLEHSMVGQFPGIKTTNFTIDEIEEILNQIKGNSISVVSCVANSREEDFKTNQQFVQGLEKLVLSMEGQKYTGIIIANTTNQSQLRALRREYENVYTQLSPLASLQINYGFNKSESKNKSVSNSINKSVSISKSNSMTTSVSKTLGTSQENTASKVVKGIASATSMLSAALIPLTGGMSLAVGGVVSGGLSLLGTAISGTENESTSDSKSESKSESDTNTVGHGKTDTYGNSITHGLSNALTLTAHDKSIEDMMKRIDKQLERIDEFESLGMFECAAYFLSEDQYASEIAASTYKSIMRGENSGVEIAAINSWGLNEINKTKIIEMYVKNFMHPVFRYKGTLGEIEVTPCSMVSGNELAIHMGLPRKSVSGFPVIEHTDFAKEVVKYGQNNASSSINLGKIFNMGRICGNDVKIDKDSLAMHVFVTGSTGSGKSNVIYELIRQCNYSGTKFMVIEPAKGEYKHIFGNDSEVNVYGTNPDYFNLLKINPFKFPLKIHVLEHVDRLIEIFNVCWPMYAAMPAVLKEALLKSYEYCGWDLSSSVNAYDDSLFPTFLDLQDTLYEVIRSSDYSDEVKSNYLGSLLTRVKSLTNGLNGQIFTFNDISSDILFNQNTIIDLSRVGSLETKSLIMGLIIMQLNEYRISTATSINVPFKHMTILEEAHNILRNSSSNQNLEGSNLISKSVEMISNAIAEMRTYGEGFVIVDQSPGAVDLAAIRNTNTKIIMRLPDECDRRLVGKAAGVKDNQLDEITKLPKGVAVVYQNDWTSPVLCKIQKYKGQETEYLFESDRKIRNKINDFYRHLLEFLLMKRVKNPNNINILLLEKELLDGEISTKNKILFQQLIKEYKLDNKLTVWKDHHFEKLSRLVSNILKSDIWIKQIICNASNIDSLTEELLEIINQRISGLTKDYSVAIAQCLLRTEATKSEQYKEIYSAWITRLKNKGEV